MGLYEAFRRNREERGSEAAFLITSGDRSVPITWRQFTDDIETVVYLIGKFAPKGVIGLLGENSYEWTVAHAACLFSGATVVPMEVSLSADEIADRLEFTGAKALIYSSLHSEKALAVKRELPKLVYGGFGTWKTDRFLDLARIEVKKEGGIFTHAPDLDVTATSMIVFTSGTTSKPRGAELKIDGLEQFIESTALSLPMGPGDRSLMVLPLYHIFGIAVTYAMLARGVALGVCPDFRRLYEAVERFRADFIFLVPALAEILAAKIAQKGKSAEEVLGHRIRWILVGGALLSKRTRDRLAVLGIPAVTGYGLTETTALYSMSPPDDGGRAGSSGRVSLHPGFEAKVSDEGELLTRSKGVMKGYFREPERTAEAIDADGWFHTGDVGRIDADGYVWITGRASRTIVLSSGKKVAPEELEEKLMSLDCVREAIVCGDGERREIRALVYSDEDEEDVREAISALNATLPVYKRITKIEIQDEPLPRTPSGKLKLPAKTSEAPKSELGNRVRKVHHPRAYVLKLLSSTLLIVGIVTTWLARAIPDVIRLSGDNLSDGLRWTCKFAEEVGEGLIAVSLILGAVLLKRFLKKWKETK